MMRALGRFLVNMISVLVVLFLLFVIVLPLFFSARVAIVLSSSMGEALPPGSLAVSMPIDPKLVQVGDIITFTPPWDPRVTVSHRVIEIVKDNRGQIAFRTKGDALEDPDLWVMSAESVTGKAVYHVPYLGYVAQSALKYVRSWWGLVLLVVVPFLFIVYGMVRDVQRLRNPRRKRLNLLLKRRRLTKPALRRMGLT